MKTMSLNKKFLVPFFLLLFALSNSQDLSINKLKKSIKHNKKINKDNHSRLYLIGHLTDVFKKDTLMLYDNVHHDTLRKFGITSNYHLGTVFEFKSFKRLNIYFDHDFRVEGITSKDEMYDFNTKKKKCDSYKYKLRKKKRKILLYIKNKCGFAYTFELVKVISVKPKVNKDYQPDYPLHSCNFFYFTKYLNTSKYYQVKSFKVP